MHHEYTWDIPYEYENVSDENHIQGSQEMFLKHEYMFHEGHNNYHVWIKYTSLRISHLISYFKTEPCCT